MDEEEPAPERNRRLGTLIARAGAEFGLDVEFEYAIPSGRVDVVWLWTGPASFPIRVPVVGFEIESSWRTRKHLKGDLVNLLELQPALGVIVLAGSGEKVEATRAFARALVNRHAARIEVWDESNIEALASFREPGPGTPPHQREARAARTPGAVGGKYSALSTWLAAVNIDELDVSFGEIEQRLGFTLPPSSRRHAAHWSGYDGSAVARAIKDAGWRAHHVDLRAERVTLQRVAAAG